MRILLDTNILFSALVWPNGTVGKLVQELISHHILVIPDYVLEELQYIIARKKPDKQEALDRFLTRLQAELVYAPKIPASKIKIRDEEDLPVLTAAIAADVDVLLTGDKDFAGLELDRPVIMTPSELRLFLANK